jgi:hypothetical protein
MERNEHHIDKGLRPGRLARQAGTFPLFFTELNQSSIIAPPCCHSSQCSQVSEGGKREKGEKGEKEEKGEKGGRCWGLHHDSKASVKV